MALSEKNEVFLLELQESSSQLACATQLIITLLRWVDTGLIIFHSVLLIIIDQKQNINVKSIFPLIPELIQILGDS